MSKTWQLISRKMSGSDLVLTLGCVMRTLSVGRQEIAEGETEGVVLYAHI